MADILNRLLLDTSNFDAKLENSKKSVKSYSGGISGMAKTAGIGIGKLAGAFGLAMGAGEAFNRVLNSSQTMGDMTSRNMAALKRGVDEFFYSIGNGDFSGFLSGLGSLIDKAKDAHNALDQLGNTQISHSYFSAENEANISKSQYVAKNKFAPVDERIKAFSDWRIALGSQLEINNTLRADLVKAITTSVEAEIGGDKMKVTMDDVRMALKIDVTNPQKRDELKNKYSADYDSYLKDVKKLGSAYQYFDKDGNVMLNGYVKGQTKAYRAMTKPEQEKELSKLSEKYREAIIVNAMLNKYKDEELTNIANLSREYQRLEASLNSISREYNETAMEFNNSNKGTKDFTPVQSLEGYKVYTGTQSQTGGSKKPTPPPVGSMAEIDKLISDKNKELINATTSQARIAVQTTINELEAKKVRLKMEVEKAIFTNEHGANKLGNASLSEMAGVINSGTGKTQGSKGLDVKKMNSKIKSPIDKKDINLLEQYQENLYGIGSIMGSMSGIMGENAASWLNWGASLMQSISQALPMIAKLIPALAAKAAGETAAENAAAGPFGWIAAGAAVAGILALFASIPAFANGGIIEGGSTFGDMNLARVNAGEMILNGRQQGNLFRLLDGGNAATVGNRGGEVEFKIRAKDLVGVISNYNNQKSKVR